MDKGWVPYSWNFIDDHPQGQAGRKRERECGKYVNTCARIKWLYGGESRERHVMESAKSIIAWIWCGIRRPTPNSSTLRSTPSWFIIGIQCTESSATLQRVWSSQPAGWVGKREEDPANNNRNCRLRLTNDPNPNYPESNQFVAIRARDRISIQFFPEAVTTCISRPRRRFFIKTNKH